MAHLPFFRKGSIGVYANTSVDVFTAFLRTEKFVKVSASLQLDAKMVGAGTATLDVTPQISNDSVNWADTTPTFTQVTPGSTFPVIETISLSTVAKFMRFKVELADPMTCIVAATFSILGDGKITPDESLEDEYLLFSPATFRESLFIAVPPSPLLVPQLAGAGGGPIDVNTVITVGQAGQAQTAAGSTPGAAAMSGAGYINQYRPSGGRWTGVSYQGHKPPYAWRSSTKGEGRRGKSE